MYGSAKKKKRVAVRRLEIPRLDEFTASRDEADLPKDVLDQVDTLSKTQDKIHTKYTAMDQNARLNRGLRTLLLGEYMLAAPAGTVHLGEDDLSVILGIMLDMVEHIGDATKDGRVEPKLLTNAPTEGLTGLSHINISGHYPVADFGQLDAVLEYHYTLCQKLTKARTYLREIGELSRFLDAVAGTLKVVIINDTLRGYCDNVKASSQFLAAADAPAIVYLTAQAGADRESLEAFAKKVVRAVQDRTNSPNVQIPIVVSADPNLSPNGVALPLLCPKTVGLPSVRAVESPGAVVVDRVIQETPYLALCGATRAQVQLWNDRKRCRR